MVKSERDVTGLRKEADWHVLGCFVELGLSTTRDEYLGTLIGEGLCNAQADAGALANGDAYLRNDAGRRRGRRWDSADEKP
jgi:hypothetical protein